MVTLIDHGVFIDSQYNVTDENILASNDKKGFKVKVEYGRCKTMAYKILKAHNQSDDMKNLKIKFDSMVSPDNNYVNILQTARASGLKEFPLPYVLSNCHNTLCAVGGTILEDDHAFGLSNVKKFGGIFVPPYMGVLHQYMREIMAGCGKMILGSDSHTRYGALGTMGIGEGGGELVKQLLGHTYDIAYPKIIGIKLTGKPRAGVGPMDVALALVAETFANGFNKNNVLEFMGDGIGNLSMEYRMGIDVMTTESAALSSIWCTDDRTRKYLEEHGRTYDYKELCPETGAYYDKYIIIDLDKVEPMIALPFHPSNAMPIRLFKENCESVLREIEEAGNRIKGETGEPFSIMQHYRDGAFYPDQALVSGCAGGMFENIVAMADILKADVLVDENQELEKSINKNLEKGINEDLDESQNKDLNTDFYKNMMPELSLHINPASLPVMEDLMTQGIGSELATFGVTMRPCICGPCFGVTDAPANNQLSIRHVTRNYPNREGSKPGQGQMAAVCLMDARSVAATVKNGGRLTGADELTGVEYRSLKHHFNKKIYDNKVLNNYGHADETVQLVKGPNITDWPEMAPLKDNILLKVAGSYHGSVTTDELIPSGEVSSYRSNPEKISGFTMISRDPEYVKRAKAIRAISAEPNLKTDHDDAHALTYGSIMISDKIGDGSSREQAASCQKVLGGFANLANEYSTKRYRSNLINWGLLPLRTEEKLEIPVGAYVYIGGIRGILESGESKVDVCILDKDVTIEDSNDLKNISKDYVDKHTVEIIHATVDNLTHEERNILLSGSLINHYRN